ncbi:MAG: decarboxylating 6-phosphogluconate dehydrogenase, partial [Gammaproteobacteria bacterium]|nr:decarboxylating 6-phosphogluconate dehydrogenase [Gammaproteobacteria bacterium]
MLTEALFKQANQSLPESILSQNISIKVADMQLGIIGLGKMGANMARRLCRHGISVTGFNRSANITQQLATEEGLIASDSVEQLLASLSAPRIVWLMLPSGEATETMISQLQEQLSAGDILVDGGNANYKDSVRRAAQLASKDIRFCDSGTSGGVWGLENGYCLMVGGEKDTIHQLEPVLKALAPSAEHGWAHVGPAGAGHFTKMIHNGIEYGMMQAMAEGFDLLRGKQEFELDLAQIAEVWRHGSVVRSWLLDLTADFLKHDQSLKEIAPYVADSGEGRWTVQESVEQGIAAPVLSLALQMRFASQNNEAYGNRILA